MLIDVKNITTKKTFSLDKEVIKIGREVNNDVIIPEETISSFHATIVNRNDSFYLEDQRSKNKTFLNGEEIEPYSPKKLKSGDEVMINIYKFIFLLEREFPTGDTGESI
jgi:pSer/pThr/pTyr-binding forkhead associated (FHA) protein